MCNRTCDALSQNPREVFYKLLIIRILRDICPLERGTNNLGNSDILLRSAAKILLGGTCARKSTKNHRCGVVFVAGPRIENGEDIIVRGFIRDKNLGPHDS